MPTEPLPFHESIVRLLGRLHDRKALHLLCTLIRATEIPANHDAIAAAWNVSLASQRLTDSDLDFGLLPHITEQKRLAEEKAKNPERLRSAFDVAFAGKSGS